MADNDNRENRKPRIIYIVGVGHSGSTLLDLILSTSPGAFSVGEVKELKRYVFKEKDGKGRPKRFVDDQGYELPDSPFWGPIAAEIKELWHSDSGRRSKIKAGLRFLLLGQIPRPPKEYDDERLIALIHSQAEQLTGQRVEYIIDSSKSLDRLLGLRRFTAYEVFTIHLIRDVRGVAYSNYKRGRNRLRILAYWTLGNLMIRRYLRKNVPAEKQLTLFYEDLVAEPERSMNLINRQIGLRLDPDHYAEQIRNQTSFRFAGNGMRRREFAGLKPDHSWRQKTGRLSQTLLAPFNKLLARRSEAGEG